MKLEAPTLHPPIGTAFDHILEGFRFARRTTPVFTLLVMLGVVSLMAMPFPVLMPIFAANILHGRADTLGLLMGGTGLGALLGSLTLASKRKIQGLGRWVWISGIMFGASLIFFSMSRMLWLSVILLVPAGFGMMTQMGATNTLLQVMSPDNLRGRVMSLYSMMLIGVTPIGALLGGALAGKVGAPWTVGIGGAACLASGILFARQLPSIRGEARELIRAKGIEIGD